MTSSHNVRFTAPPVQGLTSLISLKGTQRRRSGSDGAVEHLKTLCCLGLPPESAMIAVTPLLHEIISHGWSRMGLYESDATTMRSGYAENPEMCSIVSASGDY